MFDNECMDKQTLREGNMELREILSNLSIAERIEIFNGYAVPCAPDLFAPICEMREFDAVIRNNQISPSNLLMAVTRKGSTFSLDDPYFRVLSHHCIESFGLEGAEDAGASVDALMAIFEEFGGADEILEDLKR